MADILIGGMEMPQHYGECGVEWCNRWKKLIVAGMPCAKSRPADCPLIEVPAHGRLIDADELRSEYKEPMDWLDRTQVMYHVTGIWASIDAAPTIIPAEPPKEEK